MEAVIPRFGCWNGIEVYEKLSRGDDFVYDGVPHSLRFHWRLNNGNGRGTNMRYIYSPLRGLVHVEGNE